MSRRSLCAIAFSLVLAACSPAPELSAGGAPDRTTIKAANQDTAQPDITVEKIKRDIVGHVVNTTAAAGDTQPTDWTFEADEFKQLEILERTATPDGVAITVSMTTHNNPGSEEEAVQVTGRLRLHYQRKGGEWRLAKIENLTFKYTIGITT